MNKVLQTQPRFARTMCAFELARATCEFWGQTDFEKELAEHYLTGFVAVLPHLFLMAKLVKLADGRKAWLVTHAIGNLTLLIHLAPFPTEWIAFRRRFDKRIRVYSLARLKHLAFAIEHQRWLRNHKNNGATKV